MSHLDINKLNLSLAEKSFRVQFWAHSAYEYHNFVRCGNDLDELDARWRKLEETRHAEATMVRNILKTERRKCASGAFFISIFYTTCMTNGFWVLQVYPMMTAITQSLIVWYLQEKILIGLTDLYNLKGSSTSENVIVEEYQRI